MIVTCRQLSHAVTDYAEGRLGPLDRLAFRAHLLRCGACREFLRQYQATLQALPCLPGETPPPELQDALLQRFRKG